MKRFRNPCAQYEERICLLASAILPATERASAQEHLAGCASCRTYYGRMLKLTASLASWEQDFASVEPSAAAELRWANEIKAAANALQPRTAKPALREYCRELFWSCRYAWTGMVALWFVLWVIDFGSFGGQGPTMAGQTTAVSAVRQTLEEQRQVMAELITPASEPVQGNRPKPRSERDRAWKII